MSQPLRVLLVEDLESDAALIVRHLETAGYQVDATRVETAAGLRAALAEGAYDAVVADYHLPQFDAPTALSMVRENGRDTPFLVVSGTVGEERAVAMMKAGAQDYVMKSNLARLAPAVAREIQEALSRREHRKLEEQFRQAQKMECIGRLTSSVAHDFNNLLMVISGYAQLGLEQVPPPSEVYDAFAEISNAANRASDLASRLLAFSRPHAAARQRIVLNELLLNFEKMLRPVLGGSIRLDLSLDPSAGALFGDASQIEQIVMNLAVNAKDAMPDGGRLRIETAPLADARQVQLRVTDTGMGMSPEVRARIFEPFFTTKPEGLGTGLGLATVYSIVKQAEGSVEVDSEPGKGTTFTFLFPVAGNGGGGEAS